MMRGQGTVVSALVGYLDKLKKDGEPFEGESTELPPDDVRALLLRGRLYLRRDWLAGLRLPIEAGAPPTVPNTSQAPPAYIAPRGNSSFDVAAAFGVNPRDTN